MCNVTPTHLRHFLATDDASSDGWNFDWKVPTPCKEQYPVTPFAYAASSLAIWPSCDILNRLTIQNLSDFLEVRLGLCRDLSTISDDSETGKDQSACKKKPAWAMNDNPRKKAEEQMTYDPEKILGTFPHSCDLMELFGQVAKSDRHARYNERRDSRNWGIDAVNGSQTQSYNDMRGFRK